MFDAVLMADKDGCYAPDSKEVVTVIGVASATSIISGSPYPVLVYIREDREINYAPVQWFVALPASIEDCKAVMKEK